MTACFDAPPVNCSVPVKSEQEAFDVCIMLYSTRDIIINLIAKFFHSPYTLISVKIRHYLCAFYHNNIQHLSSAHLADLSAVRMAYFLPINLSRIFHEFYENAN